MMLDLHAGEQRLQVRGDHLLNGHDALIVGHDDETRQEARHLDTGRPDRRASSLLTSDGELQMNSGELRPAAT